MKRICECGNSKYHRNVSGIDKNIIIFICTVCGKVYERYKRERKLVQL